MKISAGSEAWGIPAGAQCAKQNEHRWGDVEQGPAPNLWYNCCMKKFRNLIFSAVLLLASFLQISPVFADANNFYFKDLTIDYHLHKTSENTSEMEVVETFTAEFPNYNQNHGIERVIPFLNQNDTNLTMESPENLSIEVTRNGNSEPYTIKTNDSNFVVRIGSADEYVKGEQVYILKYKFVNVITSFEDSAYSIDPYQELYWDTNGTGWSQKFNSVTVNLHMDDEIRNSVIKDREISKTTSYKTKATIHENNQTSEKLAAWCYVGVRGSSNQNRCEITDLEDGIQYKTSGLGAGENMTIVTNFQNNTFIVPKNDFISKLNFKDAKIDYYLSRDEDGVARLKVKEEFIALFPTMNEVKQFTRYIPYVNSGKVRFITENQEKLDIKITLDDKNIEPEYTRPNDNGDFAVAIKGEEKYLHGEHKITFEYEFKDIIEKAEDKKTHETSQYLYLNTLGQAFAYDVSNLKATVHIDKELLPEITEAKYTDELEDEYYLKTVCGDGTTKGYNFRRCVINENEDGYSYILGDIAIEEYLDLTINFKDGTFNILEPNRNYLFWHIFGIFIIFIAGITAFVVSKTYKKVASKIKYLKNLPIVPQYTPIKDITVAEIGENYLRPTKNLKVATMLELIVNKNIALRKEEKKSVFSKGYNWFVKVINPVHLSTEQQDLLAILNNGKYIYNDDEWKDTEIEIRHHSYSSKLEDAFDNYATHVKRALKNDKMMEADVEYKTKHGVDYNSASRLLKFIGIVIASFFVVQFSVLLIAGLFIAYVEYTSFTKFAIFEGAFLIPIMLIIAIITATVLPLLSIQSEKYKTRTERGLEISRYTDGLKFYIKMAEAERLKFLQSVEGVDTSEKGIVKLHEKLLPYAALFGLEKSWMKELEKYYKLEKIETPDWYTTGFSYAALNSVVRSATSRPIDTSSSSGSWSSGGGFSSSSGSSGGGGGGFSGGGGGGGGGGGW